MKRRPGLVGLNRRTGMTRSALPRRSRSCRRRAAARSAFFQPGRRPLIRPRRFGFGCTLTMLTRSTLTSNSCSTAWRTCVLCASGGRGTCSCRRSCRRSSSRETIGARTICEACISCALPCDERQRGLGDEQRARPDDRADLELGRRDDRDALEVAEALARPSRRRCATRTSGVARPELSTSPLRRLRRRLVELDGVDDRERPGLGVARERRAQRGLRSLAVDLLDERARHLREGVAAARELRRADRALARAAGALLAPRLRAAAGDEPAALRRERARALRVQLGAHGLVHEVRLDLGARRRPRRARRPSPSARRRRAAVPSEQPLAAHLHDAVLRAGNGALDEQQVPLGVDLVHASARAG